MFDAILKNAHILIVDDHKANVEVLEDFLAMQGYKNIESTTDSRQVLQIFETFKPDLILLDLAMPYLSGFEVMEQLKQLIDCNTYLPILILTADVTAKSKEEALSRGGYDFLTKPFHLIEVGLRIKNLLHTGYLQKQLVNQNKLLQESLVEKTLELENTNIELKDVKQKVAVNNLQIATVLTDIADEISTPLNSILRFSALLTEKELSIKSRQQFLNTMQTSSEQLIKTITNLVDKSLLDIDNE